MADFATTFDGWTRFQQVSNANLDTLFGEFVTERNATSMERFKNSWALSGWVTLPTKQPMTINTGGGPYYGGATYGTIPFYLIIDASTYAGAGDPLVVTDIFNGEAKIRNLAATSVKLRVLTLLKTDNVPFQVMPWPVSVGMAFDAQKMLKDVDGNNWTSNTAFFEGLINSQGGRSLGSCWKRLGSDDSTESGWRTVASGASATFTHNLGYRPHCFHVTCRDTATLQALTLHPIDVTSVTTTTVVVKNLSGSSIECALHYRGGRPDETGAPVALSLQHDSSGTWVTPGSGYTKFKAADFLTNWQDIQRDLALNPSKRFAANENSTGAFSLASGTSQTITHSSGFYVMFEKTYINGVVTGRPFILTAVDENSFTYKNVSAADIDWAGYYWD